MPLVNEFGQQQLKILLLGEFVEVIEQENAPAVFQETKGDAEVFGADVLRYGHGNVGGFVKLSESSQKGAGLAGEWAAGHQDALVLRNEVPDFVHLEAIKEIRIIAEVHVSSNAHDVFGLEMFRVAPDYRVVFLEFSVTCKTIQEERHTGACDYPDGPENDLQRNRH